MHYDVFNGDADGIIALLQLRLAQPKSAKLVTGIKRDIELLKQVQPQLQDSITVLDISMAKNSAALQHVLQIGAAVFYADHHQSGEIPSHSQLEAHIDLDANVCTALIIDRYLNGQFHAWAIAAAYGDNLISVADKLASQEGFNSDQAGQLQEIGTLINYNGYGRHVDDLHYHPAELFKALTCYLSPFDLFADPQSPLYQLRTGYQADMALAMGQPALVDEPFLRVFQLPDDPASYRISGVYGNALANQSENQAHIVLTELENGTAFTVSLRAPLTNKQGAGGLCAQFVTGGGREAAGGINRLPREEVDQFIQVVRDYYSS